MGSKKLAFTNFALLNIRHGNKESSRNKSEVCSEWESGGGEGFDVGVTLYYTSENLEQIRKELVQEKRIPRSEWRRREDDDHLNMGP